MSFNPELTSGLKPKRIHLLSSGGDPRYEEDRAASTITPGMLLATNANVAGARPTVKAHAVAGGPHERKFALEDALRGSVVPAQSPRTIDTDYAQGDLVFSVHAEPGDVVYAWLHNGEHATEDEFLTSNGDGTLKVSSSNTDKIVGKALEEVDLSDTAVANGRIRVRIV